MPSSMIWGPIRQWSRGKMPGATKIVEILSISGFDNFKIPRLATLLGHKNQQICEGFFVETKKHNFIIKGMKVSAIWICGKFLKSHPQHPTIQIPPGPIAYVALDHERAESRPTATGILNDDQRCDTKIFVKNSLEIGKICPKMKRNIICNHNFPIFGEISYDFTPSSFHPRLVKNNQFLSFLKCLVSLFGPFEIFDQKSCS